MFPSDALSMSYTFTGSLSTTTLISASISDPVTVLTSAFYSNTGSANAILQIFCGSNRIHIFTDVAASYPSGANLFPQVICTSNVIAGSTGFAAANKTDLLITYVPRDISVSIDPLITNAASSSVQTAQFGITLILIVVVLLSVDLLRRFFYTK